MRGDLIKLVRSQKQKEKSGHILSKRKEEKSEI
jgi:hypothetical protein